jgi:DNA-binding transcriptional regulator YiaG
MTRPEFSDAFRTAAPADRPAPLWGRVLRALREAGGVTQEGWATYLAVSRSTVQRWERGEGVPDPDVERALLAHCRQRGLFRALERGPLVGQAPSEERLQDMLAEARVALRLVHGAPVPGRAPTPIDAAGSQPEPDLHRGGRPGGGRRPRMARVALAGVIALTIVLGLGGALLARTRGESGPGMGDPVLSNAPISADPLAPTPAAERAAAQVSDISIEGVLAAPTGSLVGQTTTDCEDGVKFQVAVRAVDWRVTLDGGKRADPGKVWLVAVVDVTNADSEPGNYFSAGLIQDETGARFKRVFLQGDIAEMATRYRVDEFIELAPGESMRWFVVYHVPATVRSLALLPDTTSVQCA